MDEVEKAALDAAAKAVLAPVTSVATDLIGVMGGDRLAAYRAHKQRQRETAYASVAEEARKVMSDRGVEPDPNTPPEWIEEIMEAAHDNSILELRGLYARLVAAAADPARRSNYRREFVAITKALEPLDTLVLPLLRQVVETAPNRTAFIASRLGAAEDQVRLSFRNLLALGLTEEPGPTPAHSKPFLTPLGRQFLMTIGE